MEQKETTQNVYHEIPIAQPSPYKFKGDSIIKIIFPPGEENVVVHTTTASYSTSLKKLPKPLVRLCMASMRMVSGGGKKLVKMVPKKGPRSSYDDHLRDEVLLNLERTEGYNPKVSELIRLMFENYHNRGDLGDRFIDPEWGEPDPNDSGKNVVEHKKVFDLVKK